MTPSFLLGLLCLAGVVLIWVLSSIAYQYLFHNLDYAKPFLATYVSTSLFSVYLFGFLIFRDWICDAGPVKRVFFRCIGSRPADAEVEQQALVVADTSTTGEAENSDPAAPPKKKGMWEVMRISIVFCPIWFIANWSYNESLVLTTVSSATILASSSPLFTLIFTSFLGKERFTVLKLLAVCLTIAGVVLVTVTDAERDKSSNESTSLSLYGNSTDTTAPPPPSRSAVVVGDLLSLLSAVAYGVYATALDRMIPDHKVVSTPMFFGFVGLLNALLLWPVGILISLIGVERLERPTGEEFGALVANGILGTVISDLLWLWSVLLTSPLITTVGISLTVPLAVTSDVIIHGDRFAWQYLLGSGLVLLGFFAVTVHDKLHALLLSLMRSYTPWCPGVEPMASPAPPTTTLQTKLPLQEPSADD